MKTKVLIAGIGGASLGTEILKSLLLTNRYRIFGCDISLYAFGHYTEGFEDTFLVSPTEYEASIIDLCNRFDIRLIIPGGEQPMVLLGNAQHLLAQNGIVLAANSAEIIKTFSDKAKTFEVLQQHGFPVPLTIQAKSETDLEKMHFPCIIKPATGSGGSNFVFLGNDKLETAAYIQYLIQNGQKPIVQEYLPEDEGEFTVGVLSLPNGKIIGSIALQRMFHSKLSISSKGKHGTISSGYTQGLIQEFPEICKAAEKIAEAIQSKGPLNIQGRVKNGVFYPFEINPRFSASTYLRSMAGFNEIDIFLQYLVDKIIMEPGEIKTGYYLRSLAELYVDESRIKK